MFVQSGFSLIAKTCLNPLTAVVAGRGELFLARFLRMFCLSYVEGAGTLLKILFLCLCQNLRKYAHLFEDELMLSIAV